MMRVIGRLLLGYQYAGLTVRLRRLLQRDRGVTEAKSDTPWDLETQGVV